MQNQDNLLIEEIFIAPSTEVIEDRFSHSAESAGCCGKCKSGGGCMGLIDNA